MSGKQCPGTVPIINSCCSCLFSEFYANKITYWNDSDSSGLIFSIFRSEKIEYLTSTGYDYDLIFYYSYDLITTLVTYQNSITCCQICQVDSVVLYKEVLYFSECILTQPFMIVNHPLLELINLCRSLAMVSWLASFINTSLSTSLSK